MKILLSAYSDGYIWSAYIFST